MRLLRVGVTVVAAAALTVNNRWWPLQPGTEFDNSGELVEAELAAAGR